MWKVTIEGIRCFKTRQEVPLAPLTLLVGENSTGKSTFLAVTRILWDLMASEVEPNFNEEPFDLGAFDNIANYTGGRKGRAKSFHIGVEFANGVSDETQDANIRLLATFGEERGQPAIQRTIVRSGNYRIEATRAKEAPETVYTVAVGDREQRVKWDDAKGPPFPFALKYGMHLFRRNMPPGEKEGAMLSETEWKALQNLSMSAFMPRRPRPYAFAPVRTRPKRTYDPRKETRRPEGEHVPMVLARMVSSSSEKTAQFAQALSRFGHACGLFENVKVRRLGPKASDPFQIEVKVWGPAFSLVDVGYGVSQSLPILVDSLLGEKGQMFLMQQPEVHLHPRAQAELGTFLAHLAKQDDKAFLVETHSDYLIDRVRMDVRDGIGLRHDQVVILYFQRYGTEVRIHPLYLDEHGNILAPPASYRNFFLDEERRFLGA